MAENRQPFIVNEEKDLRLGLRKLYYDIVYDKPLDRTVQIKLPLESWLSSSSLNMLLTFLEALLYQKNEIKVYIEIFDNDIVRKILENQVLASKEIENIEKKIIFYESMDLLGLLRKSNVIIQPSLFAFNSLKEKLNAHKQRSYYKYSSRILALSPLINNEEEQLALTTRMETLISILSKNLFNRINFSKIQDTSNRMMFELVKNIYQHADIELKESNSAKGFTCAQISKFPLINNDKVDDAKIDIVIAALEQIKRGTKGKTWKFLCVTINDFGIGLHNKIANDIKEKDLLGKKIGKFEIDKNLLESPIKLIQIALTTDYSSKKSTTSNIETWNTKSGNIVLGPRGYGLIFIMDFIARTCGRMQIRSGPVILDVFSKVSASLEQQKWQDDLVSITERLENFEQYFIMVERNLSNEEGKFPGTQIMIEIPVEVFIR